MCSAKMHSLVTAALLASVHAGRACVSRGMLVRGYPGFAASLTASTMADARQRAWAGLDSTSSRG